MSEWVRLGPVVRTQIHAAEVVHDSTYDADLICVVESLWLSQAGAVGVTGSGAVLDCHHEDHPELRKFRPGRQLSIGFTGHYEAMEAKFGWAPLGIAAENILVDFAGRVAEADLAEGLLVETEAGRHRLSPAAVARPCVPFTKFLLRNLDADDDMVADYRSFLQDGTRGFVLSLTDLGERFRITPGDVIYRRA